MRDGTQLSADLTIPDDDQAHPVLLIRTPYGRAGVREAIDPIGCARRGWAVVMQDVRGRFESEGEFHPLQQETADGHDTIEWCRTQPWSDGRIAMTGASYNGATQWLAALGKPEGLKAISPVMASADFRDGWTYENGVMHSSFLATWALMLAATKPGVEPDEVSEILAHAQDWTGLLQDPDLAGRITKHFPTYAYWADSDNTEYWKPVEVHAALPTLDVAGWHVAGWYDLFCEGTIRSYVGMTERASSEYARQSQKLTVGPWTHAGLFQQLSGELDFGPQANGVGVGLNTEMFEFLDAAISDSEVAGGINVFVMGDNQWRELESWPPPSTPRTLHLNATQSARSLRGDGSLTWEPLSSSIEEDSWEHRSAQPVPTRGGRTLLPMLPPAGPVDQRLVEERDDVLVFTSEPLGTDLTVIGEITTELNVRSSAAVLDLYVKVCVVEPDGRSINIVDSVMRSEGPTDQGRLVAFVVGSTAITFKAGERIRVQIAASNAPRFEVLADAQVTLVYRAGTSARITLPVV